MSRDGLRQPLAAMPSGAWPIIAATVTSLADRITIRVSSEEADELALVARANGRSTAQELRLALEAHLAAERERQASEDAHAH